MRKVETQTIYELNREALDRKEASRLDTQLKPKPLPKQAKVVGYDADQQRFQVQTQDGGTYYAELISSGAPAIDEIVSLELTRGGIPRIDVIPR